MNAMTGLNMEEHNGIRVCAICPGEVSTPIMDKRPVPMSAEDRAAWCSLKTWVTHSCCRFLTCIRMHQPACYKPNVESCIRALSRAVGPGSHDCLGVSKTRPRYFVDWQCGVVWARRAKVTPSNLRRDDESDYQRGGRRVDPSTASLASLCQWAAKTHADYPRFAMETSRCRIASWVSKRHERPLRLSPRALRKTIQSAFGRQTVGMVGSCNGRCTGRRADCPRQHTVQRHRSLNPPRQPSCCSWSMVSSTRSTRRRSKSMTSLNSLK